MDTVLVLASLLVALLALSKGQWFPLLLFDLVGVLFGTGYIPYAFTLLAGINVAWLLFCLRRQRAAASHSGGKEQRGPGAG